MASVAQRIIPPMSPVQHAKLVPRCERRRKAKGRLAQVQRIDRPARGGGVETAGMRFKVLKASK